MATRVDEPISGWKPLLPVEMEKRSWRYRLLTAILRLPTDEEEAAAAAADAADREAEKNLPERLPPDHPERLAFEAELRAMGITPAKVWNFPTRRRIRRPDWRERLRDRLG